MPITLTAAHVAPEGGQYEPQRNNNWVVSITNLAQAEIITLSLIKFTQPNREITEIVIPYGNEERKVAGRVKYDEATLVLKDYVDKSTWGVLWAWQEQIHNSVTGAIGLARNYKKHGYLQYYWPDGSFSRSWTLLGLWPKKTTPTSLDQGGSEVVELSTTMACDKAIPEPIDLLPRPG